MKQIRNTIFFFSCSEKDLTSEEKQLISEAKKSSLSAYAPYSNFKVGAAVLLEGGKIIPGSNQENAAYPSGLCAERVTIFAASSQFPKKRIKIIAITNVPCGACRQALLEYEQKQKSPIKILMLQKKKIITSTGVKNLLPLWFDSEKLKK